MFLAVFSPEGSDEVSPDATLMQQLLRRDVSAFEELYERHSRIVYSLVLRILRQGSTAEEVVQDVFLQLWRNSARYDVSRPFVPWLLTANCLRGPGIREGVGRRTACRARACADRCAALGAKKGHRARLF